MKKILLLALLGFVSLSVYSSGGGGGGAAASDDQNVNSSGHFIEEFKKWGNKHRFYTYNSLIEDGISILGRIRGIYMWRDYTVTDGTSKEAADLLEVILKETGLINPQLIIYNEDGTLKKEYQSHKKNLVGPSGKMISSLEQQLGYVSGNIREIGERLDKMNLNSLNAKQSLYVAALKNLSTELKLLKEKIETDIDAENVRLEEAAKPAYVKAASAISSTVGSAASAAASTVSNAASAAWNSLPSFSGWGRRSPAAGDTASVVSSPAAGGGDAASIVDSPAAGSDGVVEVEVDDDTDDE